MTEPMLLCEIDARGVATVTLNRPQIHNAFDDRLIAALHRTFGGLRGDARVRAVIVTGAGKSFSAGADLNWMQRMAGYSEPENFADALTMTEMFNALNTLPMPTIAKVQGSAFAGATGLIAAADVAIAADHAQFAITETRIGLIPGAISPYLLAAIGSRAARRYFLTAERFDAAEAMRIGLVHAAVPATELDATVEAVVGHALLNGPAAIKACKALIRDVNGAIDESVRRDTAGRIARIRATPEGREGIASFLEKRKPAWVAA